MKLKSAIKQMLRLLYEHKVNTSFVNVGSFLFFCDPSTGNIFFLRDLHSFADFFRKTNYFMNCWIADLGFN